MREKITKVYKFEELSDRAKEKARDWYRSMPNDFWSEAVTEDMLGFAKALGFDDKAKLYWELNPDDAMIDGSWGAQRFDAKKCADFGGEEEKKLIATFQTLAKEQVWGHARIKMGRSVSNGYSLDASTEDEEATAEIEEAFSSAVTEAIGDLFHYIAKTISAEYEYVNSDEQVDESIQANEYEFNEEGERE